MTEAELRELAILVGRIDERVGALLVAQKLKAVEFEKLAGRVGDLERVPRGGSNGRRLRDRALPLGRDVTLGALLIEVAYRIVTGG